MDRKQFQIKFRVQTKQVKPTQEGSLGGSLNINVWLLIHSIERNPLSSNSSPTSQLLNASSPPKPSNPMVAPFSVPSLPRHHQPANLHELHARPSHSTNSHSPLLAIIYGLFILANRTLEQNDIDYGLKLKQSLQANTELPHRAILFHEQNTYTFQIHVKPILN